MLRIDANINQCCVHSCAGCNQYWESNRTRRLPVKRNYFKRKIVRIAVPRAIIRFVKGWSRSGCRKRTRDRAIPSSNCFSVRTVNGKCKFSAENHDSTPSIIQEGTKGLYAALHIIYLRTVRVEK